MNGRQKQDALEAIKATGKTSDQKMLENIGFGVDQVTTAYFSGLFVLLSNIKNLGKFLAQHSKVLFPISFGLKVADWFFYLWKYAKAGNRNFGRTSKLTAKAVGTLLVGMAVFTILITAPMVPLVFMASIAVDVALNFGSIFYNAHKIISCKIFGINPDTPVAPYWQKIKQGVIGVFVGVAVMTGVALTLMFAPLVAKSIVAVAAFSAVGAMLTVAAYSIYQRLRSTKSDQQADVEEVTHDQPEMRPELEPLLRNGLEVSPEENLGPGNSEFDISPEKNKRKVDKASAERSDIISVVERAQLSIRLDEISKSIPENERNQLNMILKGNGYFDNRDHLLKTDERKIEERQGELIKLIGVHYSNLQTQINEESKLKSYLWSEESKRQNKINALHCLLDLVENKFNQIQSNKISSIIIGTITLNYDGTLADFIKQFDQKVMHSSGVYQSFAKDIGATEMLFKKAYYLLVERASVGAVEQSAPTASGEVRVPEPTRVEPAQLRSSVDNQVTNPVMVTAPTPTAAPVPTPVVAIAPTPSSSSGTLSSPADVQTQADDDARVGAPAVVTARSANPTTEEKSRFLGTVRTVEGTQIQFFLQPKKDSNIQSGTYDAETKTAKRSSNLRNNGFLSHRYKNKLVRIGCKKNKNSVAMPPSAVKVS